MGEVHRETVLLVGERLLFLVLAIATISRGGGAVAVLGVYLASNLVSAGVIGVHVRQHRSGAPRRSAPLLDREARLTAAGFALTTVSPRLAPLLVAVLAAPVDVGLFSIAQRPVEALTLFSLSTAAPVFPLVRAQLRLGNIDAAFQAARTIAGAILAVLVPVLVWLVVRPESLIAALFGAGRYEGADTVARLLAFTAITWCLRGIGEFVMLGAERAAAFLWLTAAGAAATLVVGVPLVLADGALGAAKAVLLAELVMTVLLCRRVPAIFDRAAGAAYAPAFAIGVAVAVAMLVLGQSFVACAAIVAIATGVGAVVALRLARGLEVDRVGT